MTDVEQGTGQLWDCQGCGCQAIAGGLNVCPQCGTPRPVFIGEQGPELVPVPEPGGKPSARTAKTRKETPDG